MTLSAVVFQNLKTPLAVVVGREDDCRFNLANRAFSRLVGCSEDLLEGLPPHRLFSQWDNRLLLKLHQQETSLLQHLDNDDHLRLLITCEALSGTEEPTYLLTAEDISAICWIERMREARQVMLSGILNERFVIERYFKYYTSPIIDHLFPVQQKSIDDFFQESERERIRSSLQQAPLFRSSDQMIVQTKKLTDSVQLELHITYRPFFHRDGSLKNVAFIVTDIQSVAGPESLIDPSVTLKVLMARNYMSAMQLASETGISLQTISKLRNGKIAKPQRQTTLLIAKALHVMPKDIWP